MRFINKNLIKILICLLIVINIFIVINIGTQKYDDITNARATNVSMTDALDAESIVDEVDMLDRKDATDIEAEDRKDVIDIEVEDKKDDVINEATVWGTQSMAETLNKLNIENVEKNINAQNTMKSFDNINNLENIDSDNENNMVEDKEMYNLVSANDDRLEFISPTDIISTNDSDIANDNSWATIVKKYDEEIRELNGGGYTSFLDNIKDIGQKDIKITSVIDSYTTNDKLIIGDSGAVFLLETMEAELHSYGYDCIACGAIIYEQMNEWISEINKKYNKIIVMAGVNSINLYSTRCAVGDTLPNELLDGINIFYRNLLDNLLEIGGEVEFIKVPDRSNYLDIGDMDALALWNEYAHIHNDHIENVIGIKGIELPKKLIEKQKQYWHYTDKDIFKSFLP